MQRHGDYRQVIHFIGRSMTPKARINSLNTLSASDRSTMALLNNLMSSFARDGMPGLLTRKLNPSASIRRHPPDRHNTPVASLPRQTPRPDTAQPPRCFASAPQARLHPLLHCGTTKEPPHTVPCPHPLSAPPAQPPRSPAPPNPAAADGSSRPRTPQDHQP